MRTDARALLAFSLLVLASACGASGGARAPGQASLQAAFAVRDVPAVDPMPPRAPIGLTTSDGSGLVMKSLVARAHIHGPLVETELTMGFSNPEARVREGRFHIALPQNAFVSRLAMKVDGRFREADLVETSRARAVYDDILHRRRDPLLVEQHGSNELSARVFPIAPGEVKEIVIGWVAEISADHPVTIPLAGLPIIDRLDAMVSDETGELTAQRSRAVEPTGDLTVSPRTTSAAAGVRAGELVVARVTVPNGEHAAAPIDGLVVLLDTSASRASEQERDLARLRSVLAVLAERAPSARVTVAAFDQSVAVAHRGTLASFDERAVEELRSHGALGASDLAGALDWAAHEAKATGAKRVLLLGDGLATAGDAGAAAMRAATRALATAGVERLDAIAEGEVRDESALRALAVGALTSDGIVVDSELPPARIGARLLEAVRPSVPVAVAGARWTWPASFEGVQPGDERFVFVELPKAPLGAEGASTTAITVGGVPVAVTLADAPLALVDRTLAKAHVDALVARGERAGFAEPLRAEIVALSKRKHVPSPFTSLIVVESDADRHALSEARAKPLARPAEAGVAFQLAAPPPPPTAVPAVASASPASAPSRDASDDLFAPPPPLAAPAPPAPPRVVSSHTVRAPSLRMASTTIVSGRLPAETVQRTVRQGFGRFRACYEDGLRRRGPTLAGRITTRFVIQRDGHVSDTDLAESELDDVTVTQCVVHAFEALQFAIPEGGIVTVIYPLVFRPAGAEPDEEAAPEPGILPLRRSWSNPFRPTEPVAPSAPLSPWNGTYAAARSAFARQDVARAFAIASSARAHDGNDVMALLSLGEAYEAMRRTDLAARAYGSIADLAPNDAALLRVAAERLEHVGKEPLALTRELYRRAAADRPDQPHGRHAYAMALLRAGAHAEAFEEAASAIREPYAPRFGNARLVLEDDLSLIGSAWAASAPERAAAIDPRVRALAGALSIAGPSLSFVLSWETDASDVDLVLRDAVAGAAVSAVSRRSETFDGYGPVAINVPGVRGVRPHGRLVVALRRRGPMGNAMGTVQVIERDEQGHVTIGARPFVLMNEAAELDLGSF